jgi:hypothetical protein
MLTGRGAWRFALAAVVLCGLGCDRIGTAPGPSSDRSRPLSSPGAAQSRRNDGKSGPDDSGRWLSAETEHYLIHVEAGSSDRQADVEGRQLLPILTSRMELLFRKYALAFGTGGHLPAKATLKLYRSGAAYHAAGGLPGTAAYYNPKTKELVGSREGSEKVSLFQILCHEGCHQFFDLAFPGFYEADAIPMWFSEGLADCFGASEIRGTDLYVFTLTGLARMRVPRARQAMEEHRRPSLRQLLDMDRAQFMSDPELNYACSWSLVHFLWNAPSLDCGSGTYRSIVVRLIDGLKAGKSRPDAYRLAFQSAGARLDLEKLDREWELYVRALRSR